MYLYTVAGIGLELGVEDRRKLYGMIATELRQDRPHDLVRDEQADETQDATVGRGMKGRSERRALVRIGTAAKQLAHLRDRTTPAAR